MHGNHGEHGHSHNHGPHSHGHPGGGAYGGFPGGSFGLLGLHVGHGSNRDSEDPSSEPDFPEAYTHIANILATLTLLSGALLLLANFLAAKIWAIGPIILDGGVIVFPIIYIVGDLSVELYGQKFADHILWKGCLVNLIALGSCCLVNLLPGLDGANHVDLAAAFGISARIMGASIVGFVVSGLVNNYIFTRIRETSETDSFFLRAIGSSAVARIFDVLLFNTIAFAGRTTVGEFILQIISSYFAGLLLETALNPLSKYIAERLEDKVYCATLSHSARARYKLEKRRSRRSD